jgi:hypothetical protein
MKRTCNGCKALKMEQYNCECLLGYEFDKNNFKPLEECLKPKTIDKGMKSNEINDFISEKL